MYMKQNFYYFLKFRLLMYAQVYNDNERCEL